MALTPEQELLEHELKVMTMRADVANKNADTDLKSEQLRWEPWKVVATVFTATAAVFGSVGVVLGYLLHSAH